MDWRHLIVQVAVPECPTATLNCITPRLFASPNPSSKPPLWGKCKHCHGNVPSLPSPTWEFWRNRGRKITSVVRHPYIHWVININFVQHWHVCPFTELHAVKSVPLMPVNQHALAVCSVPNNHQQRFSQHPAGLNTSISHVSNPLNLRRSVVKLSLLNWSTFPQVVYQSMWSCQVLHVSCITPPLCSWWTCYPALHLFQWRTTTASAQRTSENHTDTQS